jgi:hypothetical protein
MNDVIYRYRFSPQVRMSHVERWLSTAVTAAAGLHGQAGLRLDACYGIDIKRRACVIDGRSVVGRDLARIFSQFLLHELEADAFQVDAVDVAGGPARQSASCP